MPEHRPLWEQAYIDWLTGRVYWTGKAFRLHDDGRRAPRWALAAYTSMGREDVGLDDYDEYGDHEEPPARPFSIEVFHRHAMAWAARQRGWTIDGHHVRCACGLRIAKAGPEHHEPACRLADPERRAAMAREALGWLDDVLADDPEWQAARGGQ